MEVKFKFFLLNIVLLSIKTTNSLYFDLFSNKETCFTDEFVSDSVVIIQYKLLDEYETVLEIEDGFFFFNIHALDLELYQQTGEENKIKTEKLVGKMLEGKVYYVVPETNIYLICVKGNNRSFIYRGNKSVKFSISIDSNDKVVDLPHSEIPKNEHMKELEDNFIDINKKISNSMKIQKWGAQVEDEFSELQKSNTHALMFMTIIELILVIGMFVFSYFRLRKAIQTIA